MKTQQLITVSSWLTNATQRLSTAGIDSAALDARLLLENALEKRHEWLRAHGDSLIDQRVVNLLEQKIEKRLSRVPLAYLVGTKEFYGRDFIVNSDVLIPRPESEAIIDLLKKITKQSKELRTEAGKQRLIVDVGTGSGILAITAQLELPFATVAGTDISKKALSLAKKNADILHASVQFFTANLLNLPNSIKPDILLANLPYVPEGLVTSQEILKEPAVALFSGEDGLNHYRTFWQQTVNLEHRPYYIITEGLPSQHSSLVQLAENAHYVVKETDNLVQLFVRK